MRTILMLAATAALVGCGQGGAGGEARHAAASKLPPFDPATAVAIENVNACYVDAAEVSKAMGTAYDKGAPLDLAPNMRTCVYGPVDPKAGGQVRLNITYVEPAKVDAWRGREVEGKLEDVAGDADHAAYHVVADGSTCAVTFMRANLSYDLRLMSCKGVENPKDKLLALPRPQ